MSDPPADSQEQPLAGPEKAEAQVAAPASPSVGSADTWFLKTPEGQIYGPVPRDELGQWVQQGRVTDDCQVRRGENGSWNSAGAVFTQLAKPKNALAHGNPYATPQANLAYGGSGRHVRPHRGGLILVFAILGWMMCPIFSVAAWSMGTADLNQMRVGIMDREGEGLTRAGQILGMISVGLMVLGFGLGFLLILCGIAADA